MEQSLTWMGISGFSQKKLTFYLRDKGQAWSNLDSPLHKLPTSLRSTRPSILRSRGLNSPKEVDEMG
ncbi:hypothetical protein DL546_001682 [Coniochaeta pulveracea]|uniref:Uncharacterized protein n=1 Tax=Coniochaeta pulveracea TaxID=177199 RepID=A0A420YDT0_9PEZI|nr:hypothetical protein DL546_001682 [Coniochaeta pulveracea]